MDFMGDTLSSGRTFRTLNIVDQYSRECLALEVDSSLPGQRVVRVLDRLAADRGLPEVLVIDNGPEFTGKALDLWAYEHRVHLHFIQPGRPIQNAFVESFSGRGDSPSGLTSQWGHVTPAPVKLADRASRRTPKLRPGAAARHQVASRLPR